METRYLRKDSEFITDHCNIRLLGGLRIRGFYIQFLLKEPYVASHSGSRPLPGKGLIKLFKCDVAAVTISFSR